MSRTFRFLLFLSLVSCKFPYNALDVTNEKAVLAIDEMPHTKNSLEWWYFTGHLEDTIMDKKMGVEYVIFHFNPTNIKGGWMINMAVSDPENKKFYYDHQFYSKKKHEFESLPLDFHWDRKGIQTALKGKEGNYSLFAKMKKYNVSYNLKTKPLKEVVLHDGVGYEKYGDYATAGYYTFPRLATNGDIIIEEDTFNVAGNLWYDRQWNCSGVWEKEIAWDWFAIQFEESNSELMLYQLYHLEDSVEIFGGTYTDSQGRSTFLDNEQIKLKEMSHWKSNESGANYPTKWEIEILDLKLKTTIEVLFPEQELELRLKPFPAFYYWEGMSKAKGSIDGMKVKGKGYVEMTNRFRIKE